MKSKTPSNESLFYKEKFLSSISSNMESRESVEPSVHTSFACNESLRLKLRAVSFLSGKSLSETIRHLLEYAICDLVDDFDNETITTYNQTLNDLFESDLKKGEK